MTSDACFNGYTKAGKKRRKRLRRKETKKNEKKKKNRKRQEKKTEESKKKVKKKKKVSSRKWKEDWARRGTDRKNKSNRTTMRPLSIYLIRIHMHVYIISSNLYIVSIQILDMIQFLMISDNFGSFS